MGRETLTFTDSFPPHVFDGTRPLAMYTFDLLCPDDGIFERSPIGEAEYSVRVATFRLAGTRNTAIIGFHAAIKYTSNSLGRIQSDRAF